MSDSASATSCAHTHDAHSVTTLTAGCCSIGWMRPTAEVGTWENERAMGRHWDFKRQSHANCDDSSRDSTTKHARQDEVLRKYPLPEHWRSPANAVGRASFHALCLLAFGHLGLGTVWAAIKLEEDGDESVWEERINQMQGRMANLNVVSSLLLPTCAVFLTAAPPRPSFADYTVRVPYLCFFSAFSLLIGGMVVGIASMHVALKIRPRCVHEVLCRSKLHVYCTLIRLAYPFVTVIVASVLLAFGLLISVWVARDRMMQIACVVLLVLPVSIGASYAVTYAPVGGMKEKADSLA